MPDLVRLLTTLQGHGSSLTLQWAEDDDRWEVAWITSGRRFCSTDRQLVVALQRVLRQASEILIAEAPGDA